MSSHKFVDADFDGPKVTPQLDDAHETAIKVSKFLHTNKITAAQYAAGKAACVKRARGDNMTDPEKNLADRFEALTAAIVGDLFSVT